MKNLRKRLACLLLSALLLIGCLPVTALAAENGFILVAEAGGKLVIAPEYISCTSGQTAAQGIFGAMLLREDAGGYVLVAVVSFAAAAAFTALCFRLRNRENQKKGGADKPNRHEQEEKSQ